jgi:phage major head subunit gpT-like protein
MTAISAQFGDLLEPGLRQILFNKFNQYPEEYAMVFNVDTSGRDTEKESTLTGLGSMPEKNKGGAITYDDPYQGYDYTYTHVTYGLGFRVERELWEDDLYGKIKKMPQALARSARATYEVTAADLFNNAFDTNTYGDGKALCADDHPLVGGGTEQNELSTPADLAVASLQQAINDIADTVDDRSILLALKAVTLVVPSELKWTARELLGSAQKPGGSTNDANALLDEDLKYFVWHYLTDADAWFLLIPQGDLEIKFFWRRRLDFGQGNDFDTEDAKFKATMRFSVGVTDWRGVFGTPGAA